MSHSSSTLRLLCEYNYEWNAEKRVLLHWLEISKPELPKREVPDVSLNPFKSILPTGPRRAKGEKIRRRPPRASWSNTGTYYRDAALESLDKSELQREDPDYTTIWTLTWTDPISTNNPKNLAELDSEPPLEFCLAYLNNTFKFS
ncbi:hypothetical protein M422DRAFT_42340 [Sphaerobolus stellatus SS14]|nr:hypothetical protein M422DRAFT_42340 [Sphaerobolus stellatus SS14]